jgi:ribosomal protein S18 acetylase RimI-like enzyme
MQELLPGAWIRRKGDTLVGTTGLPVPAMNGVWATGAVDPHEAMALLDEVASSGLPHCLQFPQGAATSSFDSALTDRGMTREDDIPLMELTDLAAPPPVRGLSFRALGSDEADAHAQLAAAGFGAPVDIFTRLIGPKFLSAPDTRTLIAEVDGEPVSTGVSVTTGNRVGVFNIATPPEYRGRGYGTALTARLVADAFAGGADHAWLQSSPSGYGVYERLGFRLVDTWQCWVAAG